MLYAAHQSRLDTPDKSGVSQRAHLEGLLGRENLPSKQRATIEATLTRYEMPDALAYLWERFIRLNGMRHEGMHGLAPFTPESIAAANALFRWQLTPLEVEGLCALDGVSRHPAPFLARYEEDRA